MVAIPVNAPGVVEFNQQRDLIWLLLQTVALSVPALFLFTGSSARLRDRCARLAGGRKALTLALFAAAYLTIAALAVLPFAYWLEIAHRVAWDRPTPSLPSWLSARAIALLTQIVLAALLFWIVGALIKRSPRRWWLHMAWIAWVMIVGGLTVEQLWIRPLTENLRPFPHGALKDKLEALAARCGADDVPILAGGNDATAVGFGSMGRILIGDPDLERQTERQLVGTFAHELAHYLLHNGWLALASIAAIVLAGAYLAQLLGRRTIDAWGRRFGFASLADPAALPLLLFILMFYWTFIAKPAFNNVQQQVEMEADRFALEATRDNHAVASWQAQLTEGRFVVNEYYWFYRFFRASHPSNADRVRFANAYRPWEAGAPLVYAHICKPVPGGR